MLVMVGKICVIIYILSSHLGRLVSVHLEYKGDYLRACIRLPVYTGKAFIMFLSLRSIRSEIS